jgi:aminoglycoside 6'-N-acetyltransferase
MLDEAGHAGCDTAEVNTSHPFAEDADGPVLAGARVLLRPVTDADLPRLTAILAEPSVQRWWAADSSGANGLRAAGDATTFVIELTGAIVGWIQYAEENEPGYRHAGIDLFLDAAHQGHGLGPDAIRTIARYLFDVRGHHRLTIDPAADNERAIRAYRRVGFRPVGVMRQYERGADGTWHDGLLMDLLPGELT